jgi:glutathione S-transferase
MPIELEYCYWPFKFRAEYNRWILAYLKLDFKDTYPKDYDDWGKMQSKFSSENPLINLPYLYDPVSEKVVSESVAISFALALRYGGKELLGRDGAEILMQRSLQESVKVIREFAFKCFNHTLDELKEQYENTVASRVIPKLKYMDHCKRKDYKFMLGEVSLVDFEIAHIIMLLDYVAEQTGMRNPFVECDNLY